ncbi:MAG: hypothetical protein JXR76_24135 [Deltaproteobacteria bacterium]|nr:hypothetical protein [Deltaproteobacteria bacterium]
MNNHLLAVHCFETRLTGKELMMNRVFIYVTLGQLCGLLSLAGCSTDTNKENQKLSGQVAAISECGGFETSESLVDKGDEGSFDNYCDAERLRWLYNADTQTLSLLNARVILNCCGEHNIEIAQNDDGSYLVTETDAPVRFDDGSTSRCGCMCVFDFELNVVGIPDEEISITLQRDVEEADAVQNVWQGTIDLTAALSSEATGSVVVSTESAEPWCQEK